MSLRQLLRRLKVPLRSTPFSQSRYISRRFQSSTPNPNVSKAQERANKVLDRVPRFLRPYTDGLRNAPLTHVISFLILHELTALIPLVGLASYFHYTNWLPTIADHPSLATYIEKFTRYFQRKGWFGFSETLDVASVPVPDLDGRGHGDGGIGVERDGSNRGVRIAWEVATAYAVTKALLPVRLVLSVWATPWFARVIVGKIWGGLVDIRRGIAGGTATTAATAARNASSVVGKDVPKR